MLFAFKEVDFEKGIEPTSVCVMRGHRPSAGLHYARFNPRFIPNKKGGEVSTFFAPNLTMNLTYLCYGKLKSMFVRFNWGILSLKYLFYRQDTWQVLYFIDKTTSMPAHSCLRKN